MFFDNSIYYNKTYDILSYADAFLEQENKAYFRKEKKKTQNNGVIFYIFFVNKLLKCR